MLHKITNNLRGFYLACLYFCIINYFYFQLLEGNFALFLTYTLGLRDNFQNILLVIMVSVSDSLTACLCGSVVRALLCVHAWSPKSRNEMDTMPGFLNLWWLMKYCRVCCSKHWSNFTSLSLKGNPAKDWNLKCSLSWQVSVCALAELRNLFSSSQPSK